MIPADVSPLETRQFQLLLKKAGVPPRSFEMRKLQSADGANYKVRVVGRGAATVYETDDPTSWIGRFAEDLERGLFGEDADAQLPPSVAHALAGLERALAQHGLVGALTFLNRRVPHRFTAVYRRVGQALHNVATADKHLHLDALDLRIVPVEDSFCQFVLRDTLFLTHESGSDVRLSGHPYQGVVGCYVGVPVRGHDGKLAGTLCHFDLESFEVDDDEYLLLDRAARLLPAFLYA
jgi:hypothetical protein